VKKKGFTLIELMIVVAIIGILLAMLLPRVTLLIDRSRERTTAKNLKNIYAAIMQYSERGYGRFEWPKKAADVKDVLTTINLVTGHKAFEHLPYTLLRRNLKNAAGNLVEDSNKTIDASWPATVVKNEGGWAYVSVGTYTGEVFIDCSELDTFNNLYCEYPCQ